MTDDHTAVMRFYKLVDALVRDIAVDCKVLQVEKDHSLFDNEASFSIRVRLVNDVKPDAVIEET